MDSRWSHVGSEYPSSEFCQGNSVSGTRKIGLRAGLNCYSCPAATGACPIGAFQSVIGTAKFSFPIMLRERSFCLGFAGGDLSADSCALLVGFRICFIRFPQRSSQRND